jgi:hypothetical protein
MVNNTSVSRLMEQCHTLRSWWKLPQCHQSPHPMPWPEYQPLPPAEVLEEGLLCHAQLESVNYPAWPKAKPATSIPITKNG